MNDDERRRVETALGDGREICSRCHATLNPYADQWTADLSGRCPGFEAVEAAATSLNAQSEKPE